MYTHMEDVWYRGLLSASLSGVCAAVFVTSQTEHVITASHARQLSIVETVKHLYRERGLRHLLLPPGMLAMVGREIPFATSLFFFRPILYDRMNKSFPTDPSQIHLIRELICGCLTSAVATPISHVPSVLAAYQQGTGKSLMDAFSDIVKTDGWKGLFRGLIPRMFSLAGTFTVVPIVLHKLTPNFHDHPE
jgi:hypothetical protein